jgi:hypothetical protein
MPWLDLRRHFRRARYLRSNFAGKHVLDPKKICKFMPAHEFDITIGKSGEVEFHAKGFNGRACLEAAKVFEQMVWEMKLQRHTSEIYEREETSNILP